MIYINFNQEEINQLNYERYHHPHPQVQKRMEVLYLKSQALSHQEIRRLCQISKTTLVNYLRQYQEGGIEQLKYLNYKGKPSQLNEHAQTIETYFREHPPRAVAQAQAKIEQLTGIKRSPTQIKVFLCRIGKARTFTKRGKRGQKSCLFCGCGSLCPSSLFRVYLVFHPYFYAIHHLQVANVSMSWGQSMPLPKRW
jgi:transposase